MPTKRVFKNSSGSRFDATLERILVALHERRAEVNLLIRRLETQRRLKVRETTRPEKGPERDGSFRG